SAGRVTDDVFQGLRHLAGGVAPAGRSGGKTSVVEKFTIEDSKRLYGVDNWGAGYFDFSSQGNLLVLPTRDAARAIDVRKVVDSLVAEGSSLPLLLRFPQILSSQVRLLCDA